MDTPDFTHEINRQVQLLVAATWLSMYGNSRPLPGPFTESTEADWQTYWSLAAAAWSSVRDYASIRHDDFDDLLDPVEPF